MALNKTVFSPKLYTSLFIPNIDSIKVDPDLGSPTIKISLKNLNLGRSNDLSKSIFSLSLSQNFMFSSKSDGLSKSFYEGEIFAHRVRRKGLKVEARLVGELEVVDKVAVDLAEFEDD